MVLSTVVNWTFNISLNVGYIFCHNLLVIFEGSIEYSVIDKNKKKRSLEQNRRKARLKTYTNHMLGRKQKTRLQDLTKSTKRKLDNVFITLQ